MFEVPPSIDLDAGGGRRRRRELLALSALGHVMALLTLLAFADRPPDRPGQPVDVVFLDAALPPGTPGPPQPAPRGRRAARQGQEMLDRLVQPTLAPDAAPSASPSPAAEAQAGAGRQEPDGSVTRPQVIERTRVLPEYPPEAQRARLEGEVVVKAEIDEHGTVASVEVLHGLPLGLEEAAVAAVRRWRFKPATRRGQPVRVYYVLTVSFRL
ncbi:MAG TPA: energy transducer TonB [Thermoanaerobaculia bacterium]|nr:energy transducer TonB [Thermoanaerobaculia bacterium]